MTSPSGTAFRFLDLPFELQRLVIQMYFSEAWNVEAQYISYHNSKQEWTAKYFQNPWKMPGGQAGLSYTLHLFDISLDLFLVNRFFAREGRLAMVSSKTGTYKGDKTTASDTMFWDPAIASVDAEGLGISAMFQIKALKQRFPNLTELWAPSDYGSFGWLGRTTFNSSDLRAVLLGLRDRDAAGSAENHFGRVVRGGLKILPRELTIKWIEVLGLRVPDASEHYPMPRAPEILELAEKHLEGCSYVWLNTVYHADSQSCQVVGRHLVAGANGQTRTPELDMALALIVSKLKQN